MNKAIFGGSIAVAALALVVAFAPSSAQAYINNGTNQNIPGLGGCPSVNVYYTNGFSNSYCVPSYTPGYPSYPTDPVFSSNYPSYGNGWNYGGGSNYGGQNYGGGNGFSYPTNNYTVGAPDVIYHPPHPYGPWTYNQPFYPYNPMPTYFYPTNNGWGY